MMRFVVSTLALAGTLSAGAATIQTPPPIPAAFEAISVREGAGTRIAAHWEGARFVSAGVPLQTLIAVAYGVPLYELSGLPDWVRSVGWEINAVATRAPAAAEQAAFLRAILEERFRIVARVATQERQLYTLTVNASARQPASGLKKSETDCVTAPDTPAAAATASARCTIAVGPGVYTRNGVGIDSLASALTSALRRPVIDRTGLIGHYDIELRYRPLTAATLTADQENLPDLATALREQLGLNLEPGSGPMTVTIFERVERPTPN